MLRLAVASLLFLTSCSPSLAGVVEGAVGDGFEGVMHVERGDEVLLLDAWGEAREASDGEPAVANTIDTVFDLGSVTKQFTAAAVLEARDRGLLALDDTLADTFDDVPADRAAVTVHQLLTHTAGFPESIGRDDEVLDREAYVARAWQVDLVDEPGRSFTYSNTGYSLLAAILERRAGQPYEALLREWLFAPLGMDHTGYQGPDWSGSTVASGYAGRETSGPPLGLTYDTDGPFWHLTGNGGLLSTPADLRRWLRALDEGEVLSDRSREELWAHHVRTWPRAWYAYGWGVEDWLLMGWNVNHDGSDGAFFAHVVWWPEQDTYVAVFTNHWQEAHEDLAWRLSRAVLR